MKKLLLFFFLFNASAWPVTRFYLPSGGTAPASPATNNAAWSVVGASFARLPMYTSRQEAAMTTISDNVGIDVAKDSTLMRQFVGAPLTAQTISGTLKGQIRGNEAAAGDNATVAFAIYIVSNNGDTLRGLLANTKCSDGTLTPPEMAVTTLTNRQLQDQAENTSITLSSVSCLDGDRVVFELGFRDNSVTGGQIDLSIGDDNATDLPEDNTTTAANNPWFELSATLVFKSDNETPAQLPNPCNIHSGDFLWPVGDGQSVGLTACCASANWQNVDDSTCVADSNYMNSTTITYDWYKVRAKDVSAPAVWKRHNANEQIDAIGVEICARINHGTSGTLTIELALMDSLNGQDTVFLGQWTNTTINTDLNFSGYFWNIDSASQTGGNKWFNMKRPDSTFLQGLQVGVGLKVSNSLRRALLKAVKVIVYTSKRDTTIADSINSTFQVTACSTGSTIVHPHPYGLAQSNLADREKFWLAAGIDSQSVTTDPMGLKASSDTGKTWTYLDPDYVLLRPPNSVDAVADDPSGPMLVQDKISGRPDSLLWVLYSKDVTNDRFITGHTRSPSTTPGRWGVNGSGNPISSADSGHVDSLTRTDRIAAPGFSTSFQKADTVWLLHVDGAGANSRAPLKWWRSKNNGVTWPDSGYINAPGAAFDGNPQNDSISTGLARAWMVRWVDGYPALVSWGWFRRSTTVLTAPTVWFLKWHPSVTNADSMRLHAWIRNDGTATLDTATLNTTVSGATNNGQMVATSYYTTGDLTSPIAHVCWLGTPRISHNYIDWTFSKGTNANTPFTVMENSDNFNNGSIHLAITAQDTLVYLFFTYYKNELSFGTDTNTTAWTLHCGGGKWRSPRPLFMIKSNELLFRYPAAAMYQYNPHRLVAAATRGSIRAGTGRPAIVAGHIIRPGNYAAAPAEENIPRRKILLMGKTEEDSEEAPVVDGVFDRSRR